MDRRMVVYMKHLLHLCKRQRLNLLLVLGFCLGTFITLVLASVSLQNSPTRIMQAYNPNQILPRNTFQLVEKEENNTVIECSTNECKVTFEKENNTENVTIDEIMQSRRWLLQNACKRKQVQGQIARSTMAHLEYDSKQNIVHCLVGKVASTFWGRIFYALNRGQVKSPYDVPLTGERKAGKDFANSRPSAAQDFLDKSTNFLITRNPFSRVFSAYVDKLFSPNPVYWKMWGKVIISRRRKNTSCGQDTTFEEFVEHAYTAQMQNKHKDQHFSPLSDQCDPCRINYHYIGKLETSRKDTYYILGKLKLNDFIQVLRNDSKFRAVDDAIYDTALSFISFRNDAKKCMSLDEAFRRVWRRMQLRGFISFHIDYPLSGMDLEKIDMKQLMNIMRQANRESSLKYDLKREKKEILARAYGRVPIESIQKLVEAYKDDFELFGYDMRPNDIFNRTKTYQNDIFDWRNKIVL